MKKKNKLIMATAIGLSILCLTSCNKNKDLDESKVVYTINGGTLQVGEFYNDLKKQNGLGVMINSVDKKLLNNNFKPDKEENEFVKTKNKEIKDQYKNNYQDKLKSFGEFLNKAYGLQSEEELNKLIRESYRVEKLTNDYAETLVTEADINKKYEELKGEVEASHILIKPVVKKDASQEEIKKAKEEAREKAKDLIKRLEKGEKFSELAKKYSDDAKEKGGDLGWNDPKNFTEPFANALNKLKVDEYSKTPVETTYGYHIILKRGEKKKPELNKVKDKLKKEIAKEKVNSVQNIQAKAMVEFRKKNGFKIKDKDLNKQYEQYLNNLK